MALKPPRTFLQVGECPSAYVQGARPRQHVRQGHQLPGQAQYFQVTAGFVVCARGVACEGRSRGNTRKDHTAEASLHMRFEVRKRTK